MNEFFNRRAAPAPRLIDPPIAPDNVFVRQKSQRVAQAEQHVEDLETSLAAALRERDDARNRASLVEEANKILHEEVAALKRERDDYQRENVEIVTELHIAGSIILKALNKKNVGPAAYAPGPNAKLAVAIEGEDLQPRPHSFQQEGAPDDGAERMGTLFRPHLPEVGER